MTAIAGFASQGNVWIGGDSAGCGGWDLVVRADQKVFRNGDFLMGFTTSFRMGQLLRYRFRPPQIRESQEVFDYMVTDFVDAVRQCLKDGGFARKENETESGGTFLVGWRGRLFKIDSDYQVGESADGYDACGCGSQICLGSLYSTTSLSPEDRVRSALSAAERHCSGVRGPFHIEALLRTDTA